MDIPSVTLSELKCDHCCNYLSSSPVYLKHNGFTLCGNCYSTEDRETGNRLSKYEAVAKLLKFPCKYSAFGCKETVPFGTNYLEKPHEIGCEFRNYECPLGLDCDWKGLRKYILDHCVVVHPQFVATNPCHLNYDITSFSSKTYIISYFNVLFLLHTKVCIATGKIYHAVRLLDNPEKISDYKYTLDIKREELIISRPGKIIHQNYEQFDDSSAIVTNISSMLDFLNGFSGTIFTVKIHKVGGDIPKIIKDVQKCAVTVKPEKEIPKPSTSVQEITRLCRNPGCDFKDNRKKCEKHEEFFCPFRSWCWHCWAPIENPNDNVWKKHILNNHEPVAQKGIYMNIKMTDVTGKTIVIMTDIGFVQCRYVLTNSMFKLFVWSSALCKNLTRYKCLLGIINIASKVKRTAELTPEHNETWDWFFKLENNDLLQGSSAVQILLKITKI